jgi:hypothetical protein
VRILGVVAGGHFQSPLPGKGKVWFAPGVGSNREGSGKVHTCALFVFGKSGGLQFSNFSGEFSPFFRNPVGGHPVFPTFGAAHVCTFRFGNSSEAVNGRIPLIGSPLPGKGKVWFAPGVGSNRSDPRECPARFPTFGVAHVCNSVFGNLGIRGISEFGESQDSGNLRIRGLWGPSIFELFQGAPVFQLLELHTCATPFLRNSRFGDRGIRWFSNFS